MDNLLINLREVESPFKAATPQDLVQREEDYLKSLGPKAAELKILIAKARKVIEDVGGFFEEYSAGHSSKLHAIEFNVKIYRHSIPDNIQAKIEKKDLWQAYDEYYSRYLQDQLAWFADDMVKQYDILDDWFQEGRSGGYLIFNTNVGVDAIETDLNYYEQGLNDNQLSPEEIEVGIKDVKSWIATLEKNLKELYEIADAVKKAHKAVEKEGSSREFNKEFLDIYAQD